MPSLKPTSPSLIKSPPKHSEELCFDSSKGKSPVPASTSNLFSVLTPTKTSESNTDPWDAWDKASPKKKTKVSSHDKSPQEPIGTKLVLVPDKEAKPVPESSQPVVPK
jgi:putative salt-induced outer membrane protein YdiY